MDKIYIKARAKVNLTLNILEKRKDNYHNLESIFQIINLYDEIFIEKTNTDEIEIVGNINDIKLEDNIIYKAYKKLKIEYKKIAGIKLKINKKIPMQAGLAGGSTDCANFIIAIDKLYSLNMSRDKMEEIGKSLGADVVPCMYSSVIKVEGIGEKTTQIKSNLNYYIVILKPKSICSTKEMYNKLDSMKYISQINTSQILDAIDKKNIEKLSQNLYNDFEKVTDNYKYINEAKENLLKFGALNALLAGSGSAVFGIFGNKETAYKAYNVLKSNYETYITTTYNKRRKRWEKQ